MANPFPDLFPDDGYEKDLESLGETDLSPNGILQLNVYDPVEQLRVTCRWRNFLPTPDLNTVRAHYKAQKDSVAGYGFFDFDIIGHTALPCGTAIAGQTVFTIPAKSCSGTAVLRYNGVPTGAAYALSAGTGTDGQDQIITTLAPGAGVVVSFDIESARRYYTMLYLTRTWSPRHTEADQWSLELQLIEKVG